MLDEKKGTCCGKCGHVHVKGTSCPKPFLTGKSHCSRRTNEMHTMDHDGANEFHQVRADVEESLKLGTAEKMGPIERFIVETEARRKVEKKQTGISSQVQAFADECDRLITILRNDELFEKERQKYKK